MAKQSAPKPASKSAPEAAQKTAPAQARNTVKTKPRVLTTPAATPNVTVTSIPAQAAKPAAKRRTSLLAPAAAESANPPTPPWLQHAIQYTQQNPAISIVSLIAIVFGLMLILN